MKKLSLLVVFVMLLAVALTACDSHVHTFSDKWSKDDNSHWQAATCEHSSETANKAAHVDINNDKLCDDCGYDYKHTHAYETETWTYDAANHWHKATCGCTLENKDVAAHADTNNDGACDTCGHIASHTHVYDSEWSADATNHWYASLCGHDVTDSVAAHTYDVAGVCTVCGYVGESVDVTELTFDEALALGKLRDYLVIDGEINILKTNENANRHYMNDIAFFIGDGYFYYTADSTNIYPDFEGYTTIDEESVRYWYYLAEDDKIWSLVDDGYEISKNPDEVTDANLSGYYFDGSFGAGYTTANGPLDYLEALIAYAKETATFKYSDISAEASSDSGETIFAFTFADLVAGNLEVYNVGFTLSETDYYIDQVMMSKQVYYGVDYETDAQIFVNSAGNVVLYSETTYEEIPEGETDPVIKTQKNYVVKGLFYTDEENWKNYEFDLYVYVKEDGTKTYEAFDIYTYEAVPEVAYADVDIENLVAPFTVTYEDDVAVSYEINEAYGEAVVYEYGYITISQSADGLYSPEQNAFTYFELIKKEWVEVDGEYLEKSEKVEGPVSVIKGEDIVFNIENYTPVTADAYFDKIDYTLFDAEGNEILDYGYALVSVEGTDIYVTFSKVGNYTIEFASLLYSVSVDFVVEYAELTEFNAAVDDEVNSATAIFINEVINVKALVNDNADGSFTAALTAGDTAIATLTEADGYYTFTATAAGTYTVTFTSTVDETKTATLEITVVDLTPVDPAVLFNGYYEGEDDYFFGTKMSVNFTPTETDAKTGTVFIETDFASGEFTYVYDADARTITLTATEPGWFAPELYITGYATLEGYNNGFTYALTAKDAPEEPEETTINEAYFVQSNKVYSYTDSNGTTWYIAFTVANDGETFIVRISDAYMGMQATNGASYTYAIAPGSGAYEFSFTSFTLDGEAVGTIPFDTSFIIYDNVNDVIFFANDFVEFTAYNPFM